MRSFRLVLALGLALGALIPARAVNLYVSPTGDDANSGMDDKPVRSLERAQQIVRTLNQQMSDDITVFVTGGTYRLTHPLTFGPEDSGMNGYSVIYLATPSDQPAVLIGSAQVTGWTLADKARNLWVAPAPAGLSNTRQLYVDGVRALRTRGRLPVVVAETGPGYETSDATMASWRNPSDIEFVYTGGNDVFPNAEGDYSERSSGLGPWTEPRVPVASISGTNIVMAQPAWDNSTKRVPYPNREFNRPANLVGPASVGKVPEYVENAYELLGTPGQWYLDRKEGRIYYVPRTGEDLAKADVEVPVLEQLMVGAGTADRPVQNLIFKGFQFSYATWLFPSSPEGFPEIQANYLVTGKDGYSLQGLGDMVPGGKQPFGAWTKTQGNVSFPYSHNVQFLDDAFVHLGAAGLDLGDGSQRDVVQGCVFTDISGNGVQLGGVDQPMADEASVTRDNRIMDNHFYNVGTEYHGGIGIVVGYTQRTLVQYNQIDHVPYAAISMGWGGWPDKVKKPGVANNSRECVIANNLIHDLMLLLADGGGIYTQGLTGPTLQEGEKVVGNVIYNQFSSGHGIYSDNGSCNMTIAGNVIFHTNHDNWGSGHGDYYNGGNGSLNDPIAVLGNSWEQGTPDGDNKNVVLSRNSLIASLDQAPADTLSKAGIEQAYRTILDRQFSAPAAPEAPTRVAVASFNSTLYVSWNPSANEGTAPVTGFTVTSSSGQSVNVSAADYARRAYAILTNVEVDHPVTVTVTATNSVGTSPVSVASKPITPVHDRRSRLSEGPEKPEAFVSNGRASIHFNMPATKKGDHELPILGYLVTVNPGNRQVLFEDRRVITLAGKHATFETIDGLDPKQAYTFTIAIKNALGVGPAVDVPVSKK